MKIEIDFPESLFRMLRNYSRYTGLEIPDIVKVLTVQSIGVPSVPHVLSPLHVYWPAFLEALAAEVIEVGKDGQQYLMCDGSFKNTKRLLSDFRRFGIDAYKTLRFFRKNRLLCDCSILDFVQITDFQYIG